MTFIHFSKSDLSLSLEEHQAFNPIHTSNKSLSHLVSHVPQSSHLSMDVCCVRAVHITDS